MRKDDRVRDFPVILFLLWGVVLAIYLAPMMLVWTGMLNIGIDIDPSLPTDWFVALLLTGLVVSPAALLATATLRWRRHRS